MASFATPALSFSASPLVTSSSCMSVVFLVLGTNLSSKYPVCRSEWFCILTSQCYFFFTLVFCIETASLISIVLGLFRIFMSYVLGFIKWSVHFIIKYSVALNIGIGLDVPLLCTTVALQSWVIKAMHQWTSSHQDVGSSEWGESSAFFNFV